MNLSPSQADRIRKILAVIPASQDLAVASDLGRLGAKVPLPADRDLTWHALHYVNAITSIRQILQESGDA
jgi:hypothetical protein